MADTKAEVASLDTVLFRLTALEKPEQLEAVLNKLLVPLLSKLRRDAPDEVRNKVLEVLSHVNKRVKDSTGIKLPVAELIELSKTAEAFTRNFITIYLKMGYSRLSPDAAGALCPVLLDALSFPEDARPIMMHLALKSLKHAPLPLPLAPQPESFKWVANQESRDLVLDFLWDCLLLQRQSSGRLVAPLNAGVPAPAATVSPAPGLTVSAIARLLGTDASSPAFVALAHGLTTEELGAWKAGVLRLLSSGLFPDVEIVPLAILASCDTSHEIVEGGEDLLKRVSLGADLENPRLITRLFDLCVGFARPWDKVGEVRLPLPQKVRLKAIGLLCRSRTAANDMGRGIRVVFDCFFGVETSVKYQTAGAKLLGALVPLVDWKKFASLAPVVLQGLLKLLGSITTQVTAPADLSPSAGGGAGVGGESGGATNSSNFSESGMELEKLRELVYSLFGSFALQMPALFSADLKVRPIVRAITLRACIMLHAMVVQVFAWIAALYFAPIIEHWRHRAIRRSSLFHWLSLVPSQLCPEYTTQRDQCAFVLPCR